jgi:uncharacterized protein YkwD
MFKKLSIVTLLMALLLSACGGGQAPEETAAPASTEPQAPTATEPVNQIPVTGTTEETQISDTATDVSPTPTPPRPPNEPGCTNSAAFVADVTIPDDSVIGAGETFTKTWRISNTGTCIWAWDYVLTHYSENRMGAPDAVPLAITPPGQTVDISVDLTAPNSPGKYKGNFVIENPEGLIMQINSDSRLWLIINVTNTAILPTTTAVTSTSSSSSGSVTCSFVTDVFTLTDAIDAINAYRTKNGLPEYAVDQLLVRAAQVHANDMACNNFFTHTGSNGSSPQSRIASTGYVASSVSENVYGSNPPLSGEGVVAWWATDTTDPRHNKNLLSTTYTEIGVGYSSFNGFGYYVLVFAVPE